MPALQVISGTLSTRPFAGDDLQIVCIIIGLLRLIQLICLLPWMLHYFLNRIHGKSVLINGIPYWCPQYQELQKNLTDNYPIMFEEEIGSTNENSALGRVSSFDALDRPVWYGIMIAIIYYGINISWLCMVWSAASLGTPTEPERRDRYLRPLIIFQLIAGILFPALLLALGLSGIQHYRSDNFRCGSNVSVPDEPPDEGVFFRFFSVLMVTYALEIMFWPLVFVSNIVRFFRKHRMFQPRKEHAENRIQYMIGLMLRCLQCMRCGKAGGKGFRNTGQLKDFAVQFMELANFQTNLDVVLSDIYIGLHMLVRDQQEKRALAIQLAAMKSNFIKILAKEQLQTKDYAVTAEDGDHPFPSLPHRKMHKRASVFILQQKEDSTYQVCERDLLLQSNEEDRVIMQELAYYSKYAQIIYSRLRNLILQEFGLGDETTHFTRDSETLFDSGYRLSSLECGDAILFYASFLNGIVSTPYAILVDTSTKKVLITIRGTMSIEDMVVDLQYKPALLEKIGVVCGSNLKGHSCHKGFLARSKWLYNDIHKTKVLKTLYSNESPFKDYGLVCAGHSLGAGCASLLAIMIRPSFPSVRCFAYEPPGGLLDMELANKSEDFIVSTVRQDDMICRISHQNFDALRHDFFNILARIKVSKIQAFLDIRTPCTGASVKHRNAKVLRHETDIPTDTVFYKRLEQFRLERSEADYEKLYLPGKIVHLLDPGDQRPHVPYYASKHEFDRIVISKTMASDHSCVDLVGVLQNAQLSGSEGKSMVSFRCNNSIVLQEEEEEEDMNDAHLFMLFSNPYGRLPIVLTLSAFVAVLCSIVSVTVCDFLSRYSNYYIDDELKFEALLENSIGLFGYRLLDCVAFDQDENGTACLEWTNSPYCLPYTEDMLRDFDWVLKAQIFVACQMIFAFISLLLLCISTCYKIGRKTWIVICLVLLLSTLFQGLVFVVVKNDIFCSALDELIEEWDIVLSSTTSCRISRGASLAIAACCFYFMSAVGSMYLSLHLHEI